MILTLTQVDRGIYEAIRREVVRSGYLPDIRTYAPNDEDEKTRYANDVDNWKETTGKDAIEVWGVANYDKRSSGTINNIIINRITRNKGGVGAGTIDFELQPKVNPSDPDELPRYTKYRLPEGSYHLIYQLTYNTDTALMDRVINQIIGQAMGTRKYIKAFDAAYQETGAGFWLFYQTEADTSGDDYMERTISYQVKDVFLESEVIIETDIAAIQTFVPDVDTEPPAGES